MDRTCSIAEARNDLSGVVREAEAGHPVTLARRGRPVAVVISAEEFFRLGHRRPTIAEIIDSFRLKHADDLDDADWLPPRDAAPGRADWQP